MPVQIRTDVKGISRYLLADGASNEHLRLHISEVGPGERSHPPHTHDGHEIFYILQGQGEVEVADEVFQVNEGEALQVDCQALHGIKNAGQGNMRYAVIIAK
ncbi:MAG: cupin domain-containing protein [Candidatus Latescibacteria bacterium]|jgi:quercetin dioxygenase-like cupin family protein|nr:cupin domain-containing protein [Candidatus Latescibacterota bacterium]MBT4140288.1 cupin domain-containing protein [Candidatus Latescibacterota bacterium]MBT5830975.1 cupin domain-containing protein [Candidatus Latescibacterota bacterium]